MSRKFVQISFSVLLLVGMLLGFALKDSALANAILAPSGQDSPASKIEAGLLDQLNQGPADFFITMAEQADLSGAAQLQSKAEKGQYVFNTLVDTADRTQADLLAYLDNQGVEYKSFYIVNTILVRNGSADLANTIAARPDVAAISTNHTFQLDEPMVDLDAPNDPVGVESNISFVGADQVWAMGVTGVGTVVAGNDTGLDWDHPALIRQYRGCLNPESGCTDVDHNYNWWDATGTYPMIPNDGYGHGTHTTGTMVGDDGGENQIGMAPGARTVHCKNMTDSGSGDDNTFLTCFEWDLAPWDLNGENPEPSLAPDSINNSWGYWGGGQDQFRGAIDALQAAGIAVEVSAGNEGSGCSSLRSPGDYQEVFTTGSINHANPWPGTMTAFSSRGPSILDGDYFPDFTAPGENVRSSVPGGGYEGGWSGTSMAGPHVTALIGLIWSANPALRGQIETTYDIIQQTAAPVTSYVGSCGGDYVTGPNNDWGYGTIDALAAVQLAMTYGGAGTLEGTVTDSSTLLPVEGVTISAVRQEGGTWSVTTDNAGFYTMLVAAGTFDITASHPHYMDGVANDVLVAEDETVVQDFSLDPRGWAFGYVTDADNGTPIEDATVSAEEGSFTTTDAAGYYELWLDPGLHTLTAEAQDYAPVDADVTIVSGEGVQQDFALLAAVVFVPSPVEVTVPLGGTLTEPATITNRLPTDYGFEFLEKDMGYAPQLDLGYADMNYPRGVDAPSAGPVPNAIQGSPANIGNLMSLLTGAPANAMELQSQYLIYFEAETPGSWTSLFSEPGSFFAGDFIGGDFSTLYVINYANNTLYSVDTDTGTMITIGSSVPVAGESWSGMTGATDGTMYAASTSIGNSTLYTINLSTGEATVVGSITGAGCVIDIAITPDDSMYAHDICDDAIYAVDPNTGAGTYIGSTGFDANFAQGMDFEEDSGILYLTAFNNYNYEAELRAVDVNTGNTTLIGSFGYFVEVDSTGFRTGGAGDVPWLSEDPISGTVPADSSLQVDINFDASLLTQPGTYAAQLTMKGTPKVQIPVTMFVEAPVDYGRLDGIVQGLGYCDANPAPLEGALVEIVGGPSLETDPDGYYALWLQEGTYTVNVSAEGHVATSALVDVIAGENVTQDFGLRWDQPCITGEPDSMYVNLDLGATTTLSMTLTNMGAGLGTFEMSDVETGYSPSAGFGAVPDKWTTGTIVPRQQLDGFNPDAMSTKDILTDGGMTGANPLDPGDVLDQWSASAQFSAWGITYDAGNDYVWAGDGWGDNHIYAYDPAGTYTGLNFQYPWSPASGPADDTFNANTGMVWTLDVGSDNCIHEMDPATGYTGNTVCGPWSISQRGVAYDPLTDTFYVGGWNEGIVYHIDSEGNLIEQWYVGLSISGLAFHFEANYLFIIENTPTDTVSVFDVTTGTIIGSFTVPGFGNYSGAGLEVSCDGNLWAVNQVNNNVYLIDSGVPGSLCGFDAPWLTEYPESGTIPGYMPLGLSMPFGYTGSVSIDPTSIFGLETSQAGSGSPAVSSPVNPDNVLWDQTADGYNSVIDQFFPDFGAGVFSSDDFTASTDWSIDTIFVDGTKGSSAVGSLPDADSLTWVIYPDVGGLPAGYPGDGSGTEVWSFTTLPSDPAVTLSGADFDEATLDVVAATGSAIDLPAGTYWLAFFPSLNYTTYGQWFWDTSGTLNGSIGQVIDPFDLLGAGWTDWNPLSVIDPGVHDLAFRLEGTPGISDNTQVVGVTFDAGMVTQPGTYTGEVKAKTNDPENPNFTLLATMVVNAPPDWGQLSGTVTGLGYCDLDPAPLANALVCVEGGLCVETDADGFYQLWLEQGSYNIVVTADEHTVGEAIVEILPGGEMTVQDFDLRWLRPCMTEEPAAITETLDLGETAVQYLTLSNTGAVEGTFTVSDSDKGYTPKMAQKPPVPTGEPVVQQGSSSDALVQPFLPRINDNNILVLTTTDVSQSVEQALIQLGYAYDLIWGPPFTGIDFTPYDVVFVTMDGGLIESGDVEALSTGVIDEGKKLIFLGGTCWQGFAQGVNDYLVLNNVSDYCWQVTSPPQWTLVDDTHPLADGLPDEYNYANSAAGYYQIRVTDPEVEVVAINGESWPAFFRKVTDGDFIWFIDSVYSYYWSDPNDFAFLKQLISNSVEVTGGGDALWLTEDPMEGVVAPDTGTQVITVTFDATVVNQPGTYNAEIKIKTSDPVNNKVIVPATMNVNGPLDWGRVEGTVQSMGYCDENSAPFEDATIVIDGAITLTTDENGYYSTWIVEGSHDIVVSAEGHVGASATVIVVAQDTIVQDFDLRSIEPCTDVTPPSFEVDVAEGYGLTMTLSLANTGAGDSEFKISEREAELKAAGQQVLQNGTVSIVDDVKIVQPAGKGISPQARGGPDPFGYTFVDSNEADGPTYEWIEIAPPEGGDGTSLGLNGIDDGYYWPLNLDNPFNFYGTDYTQIGVQTNGTLTFQNAYVGYSNYPIPGNPGVNALIAHYWDDMYVTPGDVYYRIDADKVIIEYYHVSGCCVSSDYGTWEIILLENGSMLFQYQDLNFNDPGYRDYGVSATIGIQGDPTTGLQYSYNTASLSDGLAICFAYPGTPENCSTVDIPWLFEDPVTGTVGADSVFDIDVVFDSMTYTVGMSATAELKVKTDDNSFTIPVTMNVVSPTMPMAEFTMNSPVIFGEMMEFINTSYVGNPPAVESEWDFGDGHTHVAGMDPVYHMYEAPGVYTVTMTLCNAMGCDTVTHDVVVMQMIYLPVANKP